MKKNVWIVVSFCLLWVVSAENFSYAVEPFKFSHSAKIVIPYNPGAAADVFARKWATIAEKYVGQSLVCENKSGGSGTVSINYMLAQPADGYTLTYVTGAMEFVLGSGQAEGFDEFSIDVVTNVCSDFNVLSTPADSQFKMFQDVINYCKENPGELNWGGAQSMGSHHFLSLYIQKLADISVNFIVYENASETITSMLGNNILVGSTTAIAVYPYYESGRLRPLAQAIGERNNHPTLANIPTVKEIIPGFGNFGMSQKYFIINPATPQDIKDAWIDVATKVNADPEWQKYIKEQNQITEMFMTGEKATLYMRECVAAAREIFGEVQN